MTVAQEPSISWLYDFKQVLCDLVIEPDQGFVCLRQEPERFDELLDAGLPILIPSTVMSWDRLAQALWEAGCSMRLPLSLVESHGRVQELVWQGETLVPVPKTACWTLAVGWSHPKAGWRARLPLWGRGYVVTRALDQGQDLVQRLQALGARAISCPTIALADPEDFTPWIQAVSRMECFDWIIFTSPNGVDCFIRRLCEAGLDLRVLKKARLACIGPSTAKRLAHHHLKADLIPKEYVAESLLEALVLELGDGIATSKILLPRAQVARDVLPGGLRQAGAEVLVAPVYRTVAPGLDGFLSAELDLKDGDWRLLFTSSSTVTNWLMMLDGVDTPLCAVARSWPCYCIGPITEVTARDGGLEVLGIGSSYTIDGLVECLLAHDRLGS